MNWDIYDQGVKAWDAYYASDWKIKPVNPFKENTPEFMSWRIGWNSNFNGI